MILTGRGIVRISLVTRRQIYVEPLEHRSVPACLPLSGDGGRRGPVLPPGRCAIVGDLLRHNALPLSTNRPQSRSTLLSKYHAVSRIINYPLFMVNKAD